MINKINLMRMLMRLLILSPLMTSQLSYADWSIGVGVGDGKDHHDHGTDHRDDGRARHDDGRDHRDHWRDREETHSFFYYNDHPEYGYHMHYIPQGGYSIWVNGSVYYYDDGLYYVRQGFDYVLVNPPIGARVNVIPPDFQPVSINGRIYYTSNGVYYILTPDGGYEVVPQPVVYSEPPQVIEPQSTQVIVTLDSFPINIPNDSGGYTQVIIKRSGNGFVGPQGEFYAQFPSVAQLKTMYGK